MQSDNFKRAQAMVIADKYNLKSDEFYKELSLLAGRYLEYEAMTVDTYCDKQLNLVITISAKKFKDSRRLKE